jgi:hypothetical protein
MRPGEAAGRPPHKKGIARRSVLRSLGGGALATGAGGALAACSSRVRGSAAAESSGTVTLGYITSYTGSLARFASGDKFVLSTIRATSDGGQGAAVPGRHGDARAAGQQHRDRLLVGPYMANKSSLDGTSASALANAFQAQTGKAWVQGIGSTYALFEIAKEVFSSVSDPHNRQEVAHPLHGVSYSGMCGPLNIASGPAPGVAIIPPSACGGRRAPASIPLR